MAHTGDGAGLVLVSRRESDSTAIASWQQHRSKEMLSIAVSSVPAVAHMRYSRLHEVRWVYIINITYLQ